MAMELNVPIISFPEAICHTNRTWWIIQGQGQDAKIDDYHPGDITHDLIARTVLAALAAEVDRVCERGAIGAIQDYPPVNALGNVAQRDCLKDPATKYAPGASRRRHAGPFPALHSDDALSYKEDVPGKPKGWIADPSGEVCDVSFSIVTQQGWLQVEFLGSYSNMGAIECWLDADSPSAGNRCVVDSQWAYNASLARFAYMKTGLGAGEHTLHCRSDGQKFKLLALTSC